MTKTYLVCGAGGFIGGHLVKSLLQDGHKVLCADIKPLENWFQIFDFNKNFSLDLKEYQNWSFDSNSTFRKIVKNKWKLIKEIYSNYKNLCWVDTDIVFKQNPLPILEHNTHILFQCDIPGSYICSGFMVFNDTKACEELIFECGENTEEDDQILINTKVAKYAKKRMPIIFIFVKARKN